MIVRNDLMNKSFESYFNPVKEVLNNKQ